MDSWIQKCLGGSLPGGGDGDDGGGGDEENREQLEHDEAESESGGATGSASAVSFYSWLVGVEADTTDFASTEATQTAWCAVNVCTESMRERIYIVCQCCFACTLSVSPLSNVRAGMSMK